MAYQFRGVHDNTYVYHVISAAMCIGEYHECKRPESSGLSSSSSLKICNLFLFKSVCVTSVTSLLAIHSLLECLP